MITKTLSALYDRELDKLKMEIESYKNEPDLWIIDKDIKNSGGNLCLHICGNLQHFFGAILGNTGYVRRRDDEFNLKNVPRTELLSQIAVAKEVVANTLEKLSQEDLEKEFAVQIFDKPVNTEYFIIHLLSHLSWHLGHINYHRRLLT
ncbi:DUF1572 family protein [Fulvivirgaceae bacterium BMA10]|uniref:DUF1572 family protein n=1 Tax=Splendidivirga corallicola TaxID=3051826 RepID=A0ABT8KJP2_9BACT|nr:DUF1572 family protein [Fulvivirgaceae bacterium BMA10]